MSVLRSVVAAAHGAIDPVALRAEGFDADVIVDFSSNRSPLGAAPGVAGAVSTAVIDAYPDPHASEFCAAVAERHGLPADRIVAGNGSTELIRLIAQLALTPGEMSLSLGPSFGEYEVATRLAGARFAEVRLAHGGAGAGFCCDEPILRTALAELSPRLCWLCSPNSPTGAALPSALTAALVRDYSHTVFVLDEAYCDLLSGPQWSPDLLVGGNLIVLRSMTKAWGLAGLRLGYAVTAPEAAAALRTATPPWNVNACAQAAGVRALADSRHRQRALKLIESERDRLVSVLRSAGWTVEPSSAGFFLVRVGSASEARRNLLEHGCLVRDCSSFGLPEYVRVSPRLRAHNDRLLAAFAGVSVPGRPQPRKFDAAQPG